MQVDTIGQFRQSLTPSYTSVSSTPRLNLASIYTSTASCPYDTRPTETAQGRLSTANKHLPGQQDSTTWNRFFWVIQYMVGQVRAWLRVAIGLQLVACFFGSIAIGS